MAHSSGGARMVLEIGVLSLADFDVHVKPWDEIWKFKLGWKQMKLHAIKFS
jgi:hypothetical protein